MLTLNKQNDIETNSLTIASSENSDIPVIQKLKYCYHNRIPFDTRKGIKDIFSSVERVPISKEEASKIKDWYESTGMKAYQSGEYPVPKNFSKYVFLDKALFNYDCSSFRVDRDKKIFKNTIEEKEHKQALELYMDKHYHGSEEEKEDIDKKQVLEDKACRRVLENVIDEIKYLKEDSELEFPIGCEVVNCKSYVGLQLNTYDAYISTLQNHLYDRFDNKLAKFGVKYQVVPRYLKWDFEHDDHYKQAVDFLESFFDEIVNHDSDINLTIMEVLKDNLKDLADRLLRNYMGKLTVAEKQQLEMKQMVEDFFGTKGLTVETIKPEPIVIPKRSIDSYFSGTSKYLNDDFEF